MIVDALLPSSSSSSGQSQTVVIAENAANVVLAALSQALSSGSVCSPLRNNWHLKVPQITIAGATIQEVTGSSAAAELQAIDPVLASLPVCSLAFLCVAYVACLTNVCTQIGAATGATLYVVSGVCGSVVGLSNVQCALIAYDPAIGSNPSALLQDAHALLAVTVQGSTTWSPAQLPQLQR